MDILIIICNKVVVFRINAFEFDCQKGIFLEKIN